jgi:D-alanine-D-alanine ligase
VDGSRANVALANDRQGSELVVHEPGSVPRTLGEVDAVFPLLHGPWGEDGTIQGLLEMAGVRYVGAGVLASAVGMDKHYMKIVFQSQGLPVLPYTVITTRLWETDRAACHESVDSLGYPVFVKPCRGGSSIGISKVHDSSELDAAVEEARRHDPKVLVEVAAEGGREIECGVIQGFGANPPDASVVAEIVIDDSHEFYDFAAKYLPEEHTELAVPADLTDDLAADIGDMARRAFEAIGCEGLARVDFFLMPDGTIVLNELNTMVDLGPAVKKAIRVIRPCV